jgi:probable rRNA maturation factor
MSIQYFSEDVPLPKFLRRLSSKWIKDAISTEGKKLGDIAIIFCSDVYLLEVNRKFLSHDYYTDIITFDYAEHDLISGDIFISVDRVKENAVVFRTNFSVELNRIIIHGVLHLLGYKDKMKKDKLLMTQKEDFYLDKLKEIDVT